MYEIDRITNTVEKKWLGLRKKTIAHTEPQGILKEGQTCELFIAEGEKVGTATVKNGRISVVPEGDVVVDMGTIVGFQQTVVIDGIEKPLWAGSFNTDGDIVVRKEDRSRGVIIRQRWKGGANA